MVDKQKILIFGDIRGKYEAFIDRLININTKSGPFEHVYCVGDFFGPCHSDWTNFKTSKKCAPVPVYILGPNNTGHVPHYLKNETELAPNIFYLGKRGVYNTANGLKIAYLSGVEDSKQNETCQITEDDYNSIYKACVSEKTSYFGIDLLLTSCWPSGVTKHDKNQNSEMFNVPRSSNLVSKIAAAIKPRYHFCGLECKYYERAPYRNLDTGDRVKHATRMIALADFENTKKDKYLYALQLYPVQKMKSADLMLMTMDTTECPYSREPAKQENSQQYFYDLSTKNNTAKRKADYRGHDKFKFQKTDRKLTINQDDCWFCMSSNEFQEHLIITIDESAYVTLAKGPLSKDHAMIVPISHKRSYFELPQATKVEIDKFKTTMTHFFKKQNKSVVYFERNYKSPHLQLHAVPIPTERVKIAKKLFMQITAEKGCPLTELPSNMTLLDVVNGNSQYFYVEIENNKLLYLIKHTRFPLHLGREILAHPHILNVPEKIDWKKCELSSDDEIRWVKDFRSRVFKD